MFSDEGRNLNQLDDFMECLSKFTRYNSVRPLATLSYASDLYNGSSIVSRYEKNLKQSIQVHGEIMDILFRSDQRPKIFFFLYFYIKWWLDERMFLLRGTQFLVNQFCHCPAGTNYITVPQLIHGSTHIHSDIAQE